MKQDLHMSSLCMSMKGCHSRVLKDAKKINLNFVLVHKGNLYG